MLEFKGPSNFRYRIALSMLTLKPIRITHIREKSINPGLSRGEVKFLELVKKITTSTRITINKTGTTVEISPGIITNNSGVPLMFDCGIYYPISYYLQGIAPIAAFGKEDVHIEFSGITNTQNTPSVESTKLSLQALWKAMNLGKIDIDLKVRSFSPYGCVCLDIEPVNILNDYKLTDPGKIKKIRGVAFSCKTSTEILNRIISECRSHLNQYCSDVWLQSEYKGKKKDDELQGYSVQLFVETTSGLVATADCTYCAEIASPEAAALQACEALLYDIANLSAVDQNFQALYILMLSLSKSASIVVGPIQRDTMQVMRDIKAISGVTFTVSEQENGVVLSCIGQNIKNIAFKNTVDA